MVGGVITVIQLCFQIGGRVYYYCGNICSCLCLFLKQHGILFWYYLPVKLYCARRLVNMHVCAGVFVRWWCRLSFPLLSARYDTLHNLIHVNMYFDVVWEYRVHFQPETTNAGARKAWQNCIHFIALGAGFFFLQLHQKRFEFSQNWQFLYDRILFKNFAFLFVKRAIWLSPFTVVSCFQAWIRALRLWNSLIALRSNIRPFFIAPSQISITVIQSAMYMIWRKWHRSA